MIQQIKQSTVKCLHDTDGGDKKKIKGKRKKCKVQGAKYMCLCMTGVNCCVIGNVLNGI